MNTSYEKLSKAQLQGYLHRIGMEWDGEGALQPALDLLNRLVEAHQKHIPFENVDVYRERLPISLKISDLYEKIVEKQRGGYCFEMNGLFICLLRTLGYDAWSCVCRVMRGQTELHPMSHRGNIVCLGDELYFCDVGFGGPMPAGAVLLESGKHQYIGGQEFWPVEQEHGWWGLMRMKQGETDDYDAMALPGENLELLFQTALADPVDFIPLNQFVYGAPESYFRTVLLANLRTDSGYKDLCNLVFTVKENGVVTRQELQSEEERDLVLKQHFGISLQ